MSAILETGNKYARLTVLSRAENKEKKAMWNCVCDCGTEAVVSGTHLRTGHVKSCGCYHAEVIALIGKANKGQSEGRGQPRKYESYEGPLGKVVGATDRSEENGAVQYLVECSQCGEIHKRNATDLKRERFSKECKYYKPANWSGLDKDEVIIRRQYGITLQEFEELLQFQGGVCAICQKSLENERRKINIDHDHETNEVRGLLCSGCNTGLGHLGDNIDGLERALYYLKNTPFGEFKGKRRQCSY